jgi:hypothetical protein
MNTQSSTDTDNELLCRLEEGSRLTVIGLGGIGCVVWRYLALFLHSLGASFRLCGIDGDDYEPENAARQTFHELGNKAEVQASEILDLLGPSNLSIAAVDQFVTADNIDRLLQCDILFMCVDSHTDRRLVAEYVQSPGVQDIVLISGGNDAVNPPHERGSYGNVQVYVKRDGQNLTPTITRFHPEIAGASLTSERDNAGCFAMTTTNPQILFTNVSVASAMLNAFFAYACGQLTYGEVKLDTIEARMLPHFSCEPVGP